MIFLTADHAGFTFKHDIKHWLIENNYEFIDLNPSIQEKDDYPDRAKEIVDKMTLPGAVGIALCGTGQGICIALNRFPNIRAVVPQNPEIAKLTRLHNDANILCLDGKFSTLESVTLILKAFLETPFSGKERHIRRIQKLTSIS